MQKKNKMTEAKQDTVYVVLRVTKDGEPVAFLYGENMPTNYGTVTSYQHTGQHSEASIDYINETKPCRNGECDDLFAELQYVYDDCNLVKRQKLNYDLIRKNWK